MVSNSAARGGGIYAALPITLVNVSLNKNTATNGNGGGMEAASSAVASSSIFQNNTVITNRHFPK